MGRKRNTGQIRRLIIHCSASPNGSTQTADDIDAMHARRKFSRDMSIDPHHAPSRQHIGYHYVIRTSGVVDCGRPEIETGAHAYGHNHDTIGTCLIGHDRFTPEQWHTLKLHVLSFKRRYPGGEVLGHRDLSPDLNGDGEITPNEYIKLCPCFDVADWVARSMEPRDEWIHRV